MSQEESQPADPTTQLTGASQPASDSQPASVEQPATGKKSGASLSRLTAAFANMMATTGKKAAGNPSTDKGASSLGNEPAPVEVGVTPRGIIEAILFVGLPSSNPNLEPNGDVLPAETIAGAMRDVSVDEVAVEIESLNQQYKQDGSPYRIEASSAGYRMVLVEAYLPLRERFYGRVRPAKLTPATLEVLSIVAYQQPISAEAIAELRDERSTAAISQLVRRGLLETTDEPTDSKQTAPQFRTTERFLKILELEAISQLPQIAEHDD